MTDKTGGYVTAEELDELLTYNAETGLLRWRPRPFPSHFNSKYLRRFVGTLCREGYLMITVRGRKYPAHRIGWAIHHGCWPSKGLDHINGDRADNRLSNLREATQAENAQNMGIRTHNKHGLPNVRQYKTGQWAAKLRSQGRLYQTPRFGTKEEAYAAYLRLKAEHHTFHPTPPNRHCVPCPPSVSKEVQNDRRA